MAEKYLMTYVSSEGVNPFTGETFPEGSPTPRSVREVYDLLRMGFDVEERDGDLVIPLNANVFYTQYKNLLEPKPVDPKRK